MAGTKYPPIDHQAGWVAEAAAQYGVSPEHMWRAAEAASVLSSGGLEVVGRMARLARERPAELVQAWWQGVVSALDQLGNEPEDPLAWVDEPLSPRELAQVTVWAEVEAAATRRRVLQECVGSEEAARRTARSRQSLERYRREGRLLALRWRNQWRYPVWQFDPDAPGGILPGVGEVVAALALSPLGAASWLARPAEELAGRSPIEALRNGRKEAVLQLATAQAALA